VLVGSLSKSVAPALRVGHVVPPARMKPRFEAAIRSTAWTPAALTMEIASRWIESGVVASLITRKRADACVRQTMARAAFERLDMRAHPGGLHLWLSLPPPWRADEATAIAREQGVLITPASAVGDTAAPDAVRVSLGSPSTHDELKRGLDRIKAMLELEPRHFVSAA